ncbi:MAG: cell division protein ZapA [Bacteroidetes bacterium]|nr:MAG: cell division protein ZapA [Bacteroidota bacterium]
MSEFSISITVADRPYKLVVEKEQEELFRNAAKLIDKRIKEYSSSYAFKDKQDLLAMIALEYTVSFLQNEQTTNESELLLNDKLTGIDNALNELLKSPLA